MYVPSPTISIDISVNAAFTADKLNGYTINPGKNSSIVCVIMMEWTDKENRIAVIALHKCGIERAHIFELLKLLNITCFCVSYCCFWIWEE